MIVFLQISFIFSQLFSSVCVKNIWSTLTLTIPLQRTKFFFLSAEFIGMVPKEGDGVADSTLELDSRFPSNICTSFACMKKFIIVDAKGWKKSLDPTLKVDL